MLILAKTASDQIERFKQRLIARGLSEAEAEEEARDWFDFLVSYERAESSSVKIPA